jgi:multiple sugar transport system substrate-binding protein
MNYRKDILADTDNQAKFKAQFGYDLAVPTTWQQYMDVAKFFTGWDWGKTGSNGYGAVALSKRGEHLWSGFLSFAACYVKAPTDPAFFFDLTTMKPLINNPGFVQALTDYAALQKFAPPDNLNFGWGENLQAFVTGQAAQDIQWGDVGPAVNDPKQSTVGGKVGYAVNPGCTKTYDGSKGAWVDNSTPNVAPFLGFGGWIFVVPKATKNAAAAQALAAYLGRPEVRNDAAVTAGTGTNPDNFTILTDIPAWVKTGFTEEDAKAYTSAISDSLKSPNAVIDLRIPGAPDYQSALELEVSKALSGQATPQAALDAVAAAWDKTTDGLGRDKQALYYAAALGVK